MCERLAFNMLNSVLSLEFWRHLNWPGRCPASCICIGNPALAIRINWLGVPHCVHARDACRRVAWARSSVGALVAGLPIVNADAVGHGLVAVVMFRLLRHAVAIVSIRRLVVVGYGASACGCCWFLAHHCPILRLVGVVVLPSCSSCRPPGVVAAATQCLRCVFPSRASCHSSLSS